MMLVTRIVMTLAWRNLWRNPRRTLIMLTAIVIGIWAMIFMTALIRGMVNDMVRDGIRTLPGHVQIHHPGFRDDPSVENLMAAPGKQLVASLEKPDVVVWTRRVRVPAVISSERDTRGVTLYGIDPQPETRLSFVADDIVDGRFLTGPNDHGIILGRKMAENLDTSLGKRIVIMTQGPDNEVVDRGFRIVGIFETGIKAYEESMAFTGLATMQQLLHIDDRISEIDVLGRNFRHIDPLYRRIVAATEGNLDVQPWYDLDKYLGAMLHIMDGFVIVWIVVIFLTLSFGLVNTLVMAVFERVREIGLMLALGMKPGTILGQILAEALCLLVLGLMIGNLAAVLTITALSDGIDVSAVAQGMEMFGSASMLYPELAVNDLVTANIIVIGLGFLASLSPAWRASRYEPIEAITKV